MSKAMTPSEIADWLDAADRAYNAAGSSTSAHPTDKFAQAAATIRAQAEALKIATEALEPIRTSPTLYDARSRAEQALARIKEVGA